MDKERRSQNDSGMKKRPPARYDENGNLIPPKKRPPMRYDENGNPIPPKKRPPMRYDENGNPIPPKRRPPMRYDESGSPVPPKRRPPMRYDESGSPVPPKRRPPMRYDENGSPVPPKRRPPMRYDENGNLISGKRPVNNQNVRMNGYERFKENEQMLLNRDTIRQNQKEDKNKNRNIFGKILIGLQALITIVFMVLVFLLDLLPLKYLLAIVVILVILWAFTLISQKFKGSRIVGKIYSIFVILILILGTVYIWKAHDVMDELTTGQRYVVTDLSVVVLQGSSATGLQDLDGGIFGIQTAMNREKTDESLNELESQYTQGIIKVEYNGFLEQVQALYDGDVDAILLNEAYHDIILETYPNFDSETRILDAFTYKEKVEVKEEIKEDVNVSEETFTVYLSGNDSYGTVSLADGRTDVNILATVNPTTKQILLTTTPRDYYVEQPIYDGTRDKLTHAGLWGIDCSMETLENLYDIDIDYYVRVNFSGFRDIIDALDGVEVYSEYAFSTSSGYYYDAGYNYVYGESALAFVRERYAFAGGDAQRGRNQMAMIQAIIDKLTSPAILTNYMSLMDSLSSCFITDMPRDKIADLVKMQLDEGGSWDIASYTVAGNTGSEYSPALGAYSSVMYENEEAIDIAKSMMQAMAAGEIISTP